jgi:hypothetical protein
VGAPWQRAPRLAGCGCTEGDVFTPDRPRFGFSLPLAPTHPRVPTLLVDMPTLYGDGFGWGGMREGGWMGPSQRVCRRGWCVTCDGAHQLQFLAPARMDLGARAHCSPALPNHHVVRTLLHVIAVCVGRGQREADCDPHPCLQRWVHVGWPVMGDRRCDRRAAPLAPPPPPRAHTPALCLV